MLTAFLSRCLVSIFGTLYPAYRSYKAIKHRDLQEYTKCLRYWVVFACFVVLETVSDLLICWIPFYYEFKILIVICLLVPPGSTVVYKNLVQPTLRLHEEDIDRFLERTRTGGYNAVMSVGSSLLKYSSDMFINSALKGGSLLSRRLVRSVSSSNVCSSYNGDLDQMPGRRGRQCYSQQYASTIGASGAQFWQDANDLLSHFGKEFMGIDDGPSTGGHQPRRKKKHRLRVERADDGIDEFSDEGSASDTPRPQVRQPIRSDRMHAHATSHVDMRFSRQELVDSDGSTTTQGSQPKGRSRERSARRKSSQPITAPAGAITRARYRELLERAMQQNVVEDTVEDDIALP